MHSFFFSVQILIEFLWKCQDQFHCIVEKFNENVPAGL